ncbi:hypothetical protein [Streptomyces avermitilis]
MMVMMVMAEWLDHWTQQAPLLRGDRLGALPDRLEGLLEGLDEEEG